MKRETARPVRVLQQAACALCVVSGLGGSVLGAISVASGAGALQGGFLLVFELLVLLSGVLALLAVRGTLRGGPNLAVFCAGGAVAIAGALIEPALLQMLIGRRTAPTVVAGVSLLPLAAGQVVLGVVCCGLGALGTLSGGTRRSTALFVRGVVLAVPVVAALALAAFLMTARGRAAVSGVPSAVVALGVVLGMIVVGGLVSASVHCLVAAFVEAQEGGTEARRH